VTPGRTERNRFRIHSLGKSRHAARVVSSQAKRYIVAAMDEHRSKKLALGVNFTRPETQLGRFDPAIFRPYTNPFVKVAMPNYYQSG
jgi:hypothetical protein